MKIIASERQNTSKRVALAPVLSPLHDQGHNHECSEPRSAMWHGCPDGPALPAFPTTHNAVGFQLAGQRDLIKIGTQRCILFMMKLKDHSSKGYFPTIQNETNAIDEKYCTTTWKILTSVPRHKKVVSSNRER
jgi:hypothetical protein